jgi:predicted RNA-binding protein with PIN domain
MTVGTDVAGAVATAKALEAQMMLFSGATDNVQAKQMYKDLATIMCDVAKALDTRYKEIQGEEPQY